MGSPPPKVVDRNSRRTLGSLRRGGLRAALAAAACAGGLVSSARAQPSGDDQRRLERALRTSQGNDSDYRLRVDTSLSLAERTQLDYGGYLSFTALFANTSADDSVRLLQPEAVVYGRASIDGVHQFFGRARFTYRTFSDGDSFDGRGDRFLEPFLDRYYYEFDLRRAFAAYQGTDSDFNFNVRVGRQFVDYAEGLVLSETLYAVTPTLEFTRQIRLEGLAGITPDHTIDFDTSRWNFDERTRRGYFGGRLVYTLPEAQEVYGYILRMVDYTNQDTLRAPLTPVGIVKLAYDATYYGLGTRGGLGSNFVYALEGVYEAGRAWSDPLSGPQTREDVQAGAGKALLAYLPRDENATRFEAEFLIATGDADRRNASATAGASQSGTDDHQFNALGYANTGLAFAPSLSNLLSLRLGASTFPLHNTEAFEGLQVGIDGFIFNKLRRQGPVDDFSTDRRFLGGEVDVFANWRVTSDLSLTGRYGVFFPSAGIAGGKSARHFLLFGVTIGF
ncbi:hypothetical protein BH11PLA1_BH11PLA1_08000 [soil metagenome]